MYERGLKEYEKWQSMAETYKEKHRPEFEMFERFIKEDYKLQYDDLPTYNIANQLLLVK